MSIVAAPFVEYNNVRQGRSCGAFTTTAIIPTPRPVSARGTPRMGTASGRPSDPNGIALDTRADTDAAPSSSRRPSVHAKYRESWTDTTDAREGIAHDHGAGAHARADAGTDARALVSDHHHEDAYDHS